MAPVPIVKQHVARRKPARGEIGVIIRELARGGSTTALPRIIRLI